MSRWLTKPFHLVTTPAAEAIAPGRLEACLMRHLSGDWGVTGDEDRAANNAAAKDGRRVLSAYPIDPTQPSKGYGANTLWIITDGGHQVTTFLLPEEY